MANSIEENVQIILRVLAEQPRDAAGNAPLSGDQLAEATGLTLPEINDAVTILVEAEFVEWIQRGGMRRPYCFYNVRITPHGRYEYERLSQQPATEIANELLEKLESLQNMLLSRATGGTPSDVDYKAIREELVSDPTIRPLLPRFVVTCRDLFQFWEFIKKKYAHYDERRNYIWGAFAPLFEKLEKIPSGLSDEHLEEYLQSGEHIPHGTRAEPERSYARPIKILFLAANPTDTPSLRLDTEMRAIDQALLQSEFRHRFDIQQHWAVRVTDLQGCLLRHQPDIVHFSSHGSESSEIILEDEYGRSHPISGRALGRLFSVLKDNIRCVVLNACYSEAQALAIAEYIDCVIGMSKRIYDSAAISFATAFYQALGYGKDIKTAFSLGCAQIDLENLDEQDVPKLIAKRSNPEQIVFVRNNNHLVAMKADHIELDRKLFREIREILSSTGSISHIRSHNYRVPFPRSEHDDLHSFLDHCTRPEFEFIDVNLERLRVSLADSIQEFLRVLALYTFVDDDQPDRSRVPFGWSSIPLT
jgi:DNA-binding MarR family transcriptional regulator